jgi:hypothetical protein
VPNELIHPNWHVVLIHYPIALLTLGLAIELFTLFCRRSTLRATGRWMLLIGALSCLPTATSGLYAYYDTVRFAGQGEVEMEPGGDAWYQLVRDAQPHMAEAQWGDLKHHIWRAASGSIIVVIAVVVFLGASDRWRRRLYFPCLLLAMFATIVLLSGAWHAGESIFTRGTAVERGATGMVPIDQKHLEQAVKGAIPPLQLHVLLAGLTVALAMAAVGLSIRTIITSAPEPTRPPDGQTHDVAYSDSPAVQHEMTVINAPPVHPARFWLTAMLLAIGTGAAGVWVAGWSWEQIKSMLPQPRDLTHIILGGSIVLLTLILAIITRWAGGRKWLMGALAALLVLVVAGQIWMGILLMYDGSDKASSLYQFRKPPVQSATNPVAMRE